MQATLQISALVPHRAPRMTSGHRYCLVWISSVKWCSTHVAVSTRETVSEERRSKHEQHTVSQISDLHCDLLHAV